MRDSFLRLKKYVEDNMKFEDVRLRMAIESDDKIHRAANLSTFLRILRFIERELDDSNINSEKINCNHENNGTPWRKGWTEPAEYFFECLKCGEFYK